MVEENKKLEDEQTKDKVGESKDSGEGTQSEADKEIERLNAETERLNKAIAENENAKARKKIAGTLEGGQPPVEKKEETPKEYKDRVMGMQQ